MAKARGVRGAAALCAVSGLVYLLARSVLYAAVSALMGLVQPGASLAKPVGFSTAAVQLLQIVVGVGAMAVPLLLLLHSTRLRADDLRIALPAPWSPGFCLSVFMGIAGLSNLFGGLLNHLFGVESEGTMLASGGVDLLTQFLALCVVPAITEELFFRGALQGLMRPSGSAAAIFAPALLFGLLHLDLTQGLTAFACGIFLGWLAERSGSILPGMALHFFNNLLAFFTLYLRLYAPAGAAIAAELFILLFFPLFGLWLLFHARRQGFRFAAGLRPGVDVLSVFSSPVYSLVVAFLLVYTIVLG